MVWKADAPQGNEAAKVAPFVVPYTRGKVLDIGCGPWPCWPHFIGYDNITEFTGITDPKTGQHWTPDIVGEAEDLGIFADGQFNAVFSSHLLEHLEDTEAVLREWWRVIKDDWYLVLYLPHADLYPNMGEPGANPDHKHDMRPEDIEKIMERIGSWDLVVNETRGQADEYSFLQVYKKAPTGDVPVHTRSYLDLQGDPRPKCLVVRYGGLGDHLIASTILPKLKAKGYHITYNCTPQGEAVLRHNPHIDRFLIQDRDQVPPPQLTEYWKATGEAYDLAINLSESLEGTLLKLPGRRDHALSHEARRMVCDFNYLEFAHAIAGVSGEPECIFYSTDEEKDWAARFRKKHKKSPIVLWALGGSAVHKVYPHVDIVTCWLLEHTDAKILFVGSHHEQQLEYQTVQTAARHFLKMTQADMDKAKLSELLAKLKEHFGQNRILCTCGKWDVREMMTFAAEQADVVVGPETGVMHAVGMIETPKVLFLSHSNRFNIAEYWWNYSALEPVDCPCYPCHMLHTNWDSCVRAKNDKGEDSGSALCAWNISAQRVFKTIIYWLRERGYEKSIHLDEQAEMPHGPRLSHTDR